MSYFQKSIGVLALAILFYVLVPSGQPIKSVGLLFLGSVVGYLMAKSEKFD